MHQCLSCGVAFSRRDFVFTLSFATLDCDRASDCLELNFPDKNDAKSKCNYTYL